MSEQIKSPEVVCAEETKTKMLGAHVDEEIYWAFKRASAMRGETSREAILHAAYMYIDAVEPEGKSV